MAKRPNPLPVRRPPGVHQIFDPKIPGWSQKSWRERLDHVADRLSNSESYADRLWFQRLLERVVIDAYQMRALRLSDISKDQVPHDDDLQRIPAVRLGFMDRLQERRISKNDWMVPVVRAGEITSLFGGDGPHWGKKTWEERIELAQYYACEGYEAIGPGYGRALEDRFICEAWFHGALDFGIRIDEVDAPAVSKPAGWFSGFFSPSAA